MTNKPPIDAAELAEIEAEYRHAAGYASTWSRGLALGKFCYERLPQLFTALRQAPDPTKPGREDEALWHEANELAEVRGRLADTYLLQLAAARQEAERWQKELADTVEANRRMRQERDTAKSDASQAGQEAEKLREEVYRLEITVNTEARADALREAAKAVCMPCANGLLPDARGAHECTGISTSHQVWTTELKPCKAKAIHALLAAPNPAPVDSAEQAKP